MSRVPADREVKLGLTSAKEYWAEIVLPAYAQFQAEPNRANAVNAAVTAWHVHEWIWHEQRPGGDTSETLPSFRKTLFDECHEMHWIRDVADASKHRKLGRSSPPGKRKDVQRVASEARLVGSLNSGPLNTMAMNEACLVRSPLAIMLTDGSTYGFGEVLSHVIDYWRTKYFP